MPALVIGQVQREQIATLRAIAGANPQDPRDVMFAAERGGEVFRAMMALLTVELPIGYFVTYSHETQPIGLCHHLSVSVRRPNKMPSVEAVEMILEEFGMRPLQTSASIWNEQISPTIAAVNIVQKVEA